LALVEAAAPVAVEEAAQGSGPDCGVSRPPGQSRRRRTRQGLDAFAREHGVAAPAAM
jgi:hypothetical protein